MTNEIKTVAGVENYKLTASNGRHIRIATKVIFTDGTECKFIEKMTKKQALSQVTEYSN